MALDKNLFTLNIEQSKVEPSAIDLIDPSGTVHYRKRWIPNEAGTYLFSLSDPLSDSLLATATAPSATSKEKVIELHNPSVTVPLSFKGTLTFKWGFVWEQHQFEWKREACYMIRKPDPPVLVAITKEPAGKIKTSLVQVLDYNLNRFDIEDRKGLEIVLLTSLLTFTDQSEQSRAKPNEASAAAPTPNTPPADPAAPLPPRPPKPEGWGDQIAILQAKEQREINEIIVGEVGSVEEYVKHCISLLNDDTLLFITLRSHSAEFVSKVVQVAEATKRTRFKSGGWDEELHQYVSTSDDAPKESGKGKGPPRVINLDDRAAGAPAGPSKSYRPPASLTIHLSKIAMPELEPKAKKGQKPPSSGGHSKASSDAKGQRPGKKPSSTLSKPRPASPTQQPPSGLRARLTSFTSRPASPPPGPRPSSAPNHDMPAQPSHAPSHPHAPHSPHPPPHSRIPSNSQHSHPAYVGGPPPSHAPPHLVHAYSHPPTGPVPNGFHPFPGPGLMNAPHGNNPYAYPMQYAPQPPQQAMPPGGRLNMFIRR